MRSLSAAAAFVNVVSLVASFLPALERGGAPAEADIASPNVHTFGATINRNVILGETTCAAAGGRVGRAPIASPLAHLV